MEIMKKVHHENIVKLHGLYQTNNNMLYRHLIYAMRTFSLFGQEQ